MIGGNASIGHDLLKIPIQETIKYVENYSERDHIVGEVVPFEINRKGWQLTFKLKGPLLSFSGQFD